MTPTLIGAFVAVGAGAVLVVAGLVRRNEKPDDWLAQFLEPQAGHDGQTGDEADSSSPVVDGTVGFATRVIEQVDAKGKLHTKLEQARVPMKPGEFAVVVGCFGLVGAALVTVLTRQWAMGLLVLAVSPAGGFGFLHYRIGRRRKAFGAQLPDALSLVAASLEAGHTFLRAVQMMCEEADEPLASEFGRVVSETQLGDPVVDALDRMARRVDVEDAVWVVQAIRIQQEVGGTLGELLHTLADFMRAREEIRREVDVLTAEGRISGWVVGALPLVVFGAISMLQPKYMKPMYKGWGPIWLGIAGASVAIGMVLIQRMARIKI